MDIINYNKIICRAILITEFLKMSYLLNQKCLDVRTLSKFRQKWHAEF